MREPIEYVPVSMQGGDQVPPAPPPPDPPPPTQPEPIGVAR